MIVHILFSCSFLVSDAHIFIKTVSGQYLFTWSLIITSSVQNTKWVDFSCGYCVSYGIHHSCWNMILMGIHHSWWNMILILVSPENSSLIMVFRIRVGFSYG